MEVELNCVDVHLKIHVTTIQTRYMMTEVVSTTTNAESATVQALSTNVVVRIFLRETAIVRGIS